MIVYGKFLLNCVNFYKISEKCTQNNNNKKLKTQNKRFIFKFFNEINFVLGD